MPRTVARQSLGTTILLLLLLLMFLAGCRPSEPPEEKTAGRETSPIPAPLPPATPEPGSPEAGSNPPAPDDTNQLPLPTSKGGVENLAFAEKKRPRVAIIIDDMGYHRQLGCQLLQLDLNLTYSFLPDAPYTGEQAAMAFQFGRDILVHLPMEPKDAAWNPGADALTAQDSPECIREKMARMLAAVPHAVGANNHMGSRFTEDAGLMQVVIKSLKNRSYFFVDSYTTAASQGLATARQLGVPSARRQVFLDTVQEPQKICRQVERLIAGAKKQGEAIGIGHPNRAMLAALTQCGEQFREVEIVGAHWLVQ